MGEHFPLLEPVNRATAAREFRVFHAALHSLNSAYRDSVSKTQRDTCWKLKTSQDLLAYSFPAHYAQLESRKMLQVDLECDV